MKAGVKEAAVPERLVRVRLDDLTEVQLITGPDSDPACRHAPLGALFHGATGTKLPHLATCHTRYEDGHNREKSTDTHNHDAAGMELPHLATCHTQHYRQWGLRSPATPTRQ